MVNCIRPQIQVWFSITFSTIKSDRKFLQPLTDNLSSFILSASMIHLKNILLGGVTMLKVTAPAWKYIGDYFLQKSLEQYYA